MKIQLIRNATLRVNYAGHTFLIDPYFAPKHTLPSFTGRSQNPLVDLPCPPSEIIKDVEMVVVSHLHTDHFDTLAQEMLPKETPIFCQPGNEAQIKEKGFSSVSPVDSKVEWRGITICRTAGRHGSSEAVLSDMGTVSGFVFKAANEPTLYVTGDTVWYTDVQTAINQHQPDVIVTHSGGAVWGDNELIIMDAEQTAAVCRYAQKSTVIAVHLESLDHCLTSRADLRNYARDAGIPDEQLIIPKDGFLVGKIDAFKL